MKNISLKIESIRLPGDGVGKHNNKSVYVPFTCSGDEIEAKITEESSNRIQADLLELKHASALRQTPPCEYFTKCGGCKLQHVNEKTYDDFKIGIIKDVLRDLGLKDMQMLPFYKVPQNSRRRVDLKVAVEKDTVKLGFFATRSHDVVDVQKCIVAEDSINAILPALREAISSLQKPSIVNSVSITKLAEGLDILIIAKSKLTDKDAEAFSQLAKGENIIRLSQTYDALDKSYEKIIDLQRAYVKFGETQVNIPVGSFLQATSSSQDKLIDFVVQNLKNSKKVADLYAGCGTFSFPLMKSAKFIGSYEGFEAMVSAIYSATIKNNLDNKINATERDLFKKPLTDKELNNFDAVVINPPRNGALPQIKNISKSRINKLVMVSCSPETFKRDAKNLLQNGFKISSLQPVDQFLYSSHMEIAACFVR